MTAKHEPRQKRRVPVAQLHLIGLPLAVYYLFFCVRFNDGALLATAEADGSGFFQAIVPTWEATGFYLAWLGFQAVLQVLAPGRVVEGLPLADGSRLKYRVNGLAAFLITIAILGLGTWQGGSRRRWWRGGGRRRSRCCRRSTS